VEPADDDEPDAQAELERAMTIVRRGSSQTVRTEDQLNRALLRHGIAPEVAAEAVARSRDAGIVDDSAYATAFAAERARKGHAWGRIRADLRQRGVPDAIIETARPGDGGDPDAAAFDVAIKRAGRMNGLEFETALRRLVGYLVRRGHHEGVAVKVARQALHHEREEQRAAER